MSAQLLALSRAVTEGNSLLRQARHVRRVRVELNVSEPVERWNGLIGFPIPTHLQSNPMLDRIRRDLIQGTVERIRVGMLSVAYELGQPLTTLGLSPMLSDVQRVFSDAALFQFSQALRTADDQLDHIDWTARFTLVNSGWPALDFVFNRSDRLRAFFEYSRSGIRGLGSHVRTQFRAYRFYRLNEVVKRWWAVPYLHRNGVVLRAAIRAHKKREYAVAIPALLCAIDGLSWAIHQGVPATGKQATKKTSFAIYAPLVARRFRQFGGRSVGQAVDKIFKGYDFKSNVRPPSSLNRHAIVHGKAGRYHTEENSLKVILLLEGFANIARALMNRHLMK